MALQFSGTAGCYIGSTTIPAMTGLTICGWGQLLADRNALSNIFSVETTAPGYSYIGMSTTADGTTLAAQTEFATTGFLSLSVNDIFFWCLTCTGAGTGTLKGYAAKLGDTSFTTQLMDPPDVDTGTGYLKFGDNAYSEPFNGTLDNIIIYSSALTDAEVEAQFRRRLPIKSPWAWYPMIGASLSDTYKDFSGNGRDLTVGSSAPSLIDSLPVSWGAPTLYVPITSSPQTATVFVDTNVTGWSSSAGGSLYDTLNEAVADDADYIYTTGNNTARFKLQPLNDPLASGNHVLSYRLRSLPGYNMRVKLYEGGGTTIGGGSLITTITHAPAPTSFTTYSYTLDGATEADAITNYTDLYVEFEKY